MERKERYFGRIRELRRGKFWWRKDFEEERKFCTTNVLNVPGYILFRPILIAEHERRSYNVKVGAKFAWNSSPRLDKLVYSAKSKTARCLRMNTYEGNVYA